MSDRHILILKPRTTTPAVVQISGDEEVLKKTFTRLTGVEVEDSMTLFRLPSHPFVNGGWVVTLERYVTEL
jgi:hypothetical protein